jgi:hypothetical protein
MYKYFLVWEYRSFFSEGKQNGVITLDNPITSSEDVKNIERMICRKCNHWQVIITNIVRLED